MPFVPVNKIVEKFNGSIRCIQRAYEASTQGDINSAQRELESSATAVYQSIEWTIKTVLLRKFTDPQTHRNEIAIIEASNFHHKIDLFVREALPSSPVKIEFEVIKELKSSVRNQPEHSGLVPHFNSLKKVILEAEKIIKNYLDDKAILEELPKEMKYEAQSEEHWTKFVESCDSFAKDRNFILLVGPASEIDHKKLTSLGLVDWSLVLDFNPETETKGFYAAFAKELENRRTIHLITNQDPVSSFSPFIATYWVACNGLKGRIGTVTSSFKQWSYDYNRFLNSLFSKYHASLGDRPSTLIVLWNNRQYVHKSCESLFNIFSASITFVYACEKVHEMSDVYDQYEGTTIEISPQSISNGILKIRNFFNSDIDAESVTLSHKDDGYVAIANNDFLWIEEDFELIHRNIIDNKPLITDREEFLKGKAISWEGLHMHHDIDRELTSPLKKKAERALKERKPVLIQLHHYPGIGGTTLGRRVIWDLHNENPVLVLKKYRSQETINRIYKVFELTKLAPLILVDAANASYDEIERLFNEIRSRSFPAVILSIQRKHDSGNLKDNFYLPDILTDLEFRTFIDSYISNVPQKKKDFERIAESGVIQERHPFFLGLIAYEKEFYNLQHFVSKCLSNASETHRKIMVFISLAHIYAQQALSAQLLSGILMTPESQIIKLQKYLPQELLHLLINGEENNWRPLHYLVGKELIEQILSGGSSNKAIWKQNLPDLAIDLIKAIASKSGDPSDTEMELLRRLFIYRENQEILGREESLFSTLVEEGVLSDEARLRIFKQMTESFPNESHFWGHLARFYNIKMHNNDEALIAVNKAIELSDESDALLFHMKGMCLRSKAYELINYWRGNKNIQPEAIKKINELVEESSESFQECRELNPSNEHGYISEVQMLIQLIDFVFSISSQTSRADFMRTLNPFYRNLLDKTETLLDQARRINRERGENVYIKKCELSLQEMFENYSSVIEGWNNLLSSKDVVKPPIRRQIVRAYQRRSKSWNNIEKKDLLRMVTLLEDNIQEEPGNETNIYLWFQCARNIETIDINTAISKIANWRSNSNSLDATYYLSVLHTIQAINGTSASKLKAEQLIKELSEKSRNLPYRTHCFEWLGKETGLKTLARNGEIASKDESNDTVINHDLLKPIQGKISWIKGPEAGLVELECGIKAFFVPAREGFIKDKDLNQNVLVYLGFSYDGLRAWDVKRLE